MIFKKVKWKNLFSYGKGWTEMRLDTGQTINIIGENGTGKSVFVESVFFALTGKPLRKCKKEQIVNLSNKKDCLVELTVQAGKSEYTITRGAKPSIFTIKKDGEPLDEAAMMLDTQSYLEMVLGYSPKNLSHTLIMSTTYYIPFLRLPAADKRLFIEDILAIEIFSVMNRLVKAKLSILKDEIRDITSEIDKLHYKLNMVLEFNKQQRAMTNEHIAEYEQSIKTKRETTEDEISSMMKKADAAKKSQLESNNEMIAGLSENIQSQKESALDEIVALKKKAKNIKKEMSDLQDKSVLLHESAYQAKTDHTALTEKRSKVFHDKMDANETLSEQETKYQENLDKGSKVRYKISIELKSKETDLEYYEKTDECTQCKQPMDPKFKSSQLHDIRTEIIELEKRLTKVDEELSKVYILKTKIDDFRNNKITPLDELITGMDKTLSDYQKGWIDDESGITANDKLIKVHKNQLEDLKISKDQIKESAERRIKDIEKQIQNIRDESNKINDQQKVDWDEMLGKIKTNSDTAIQQIEKKIETLKSGFDKKLKDDKEPALEVEKVKSNQKQLLFKKLVHDTTINILSDKGIKTYIIKRYLPKLNKFVNQYLNILSAPYEISFDEELTETIALRGYDRLSYNNFSEGERQRCDIALLFAFLDIAKLKNSLTSNLLIMDEIFDRSLDDEGITGILNIIESMKSKGFTIVNISHKHQLADKFDVTYRARKDKFSSLEVM